MTSIKLLRLALDVDSREVRETTGITSDRLTLIELGHAAVPASLVAFFASKLGINEKVLKVFFIGAERCVPGFEPCRQFALRVLYGYLKFSLWMSAFDETQKKVSP